MKKNHDKTSRSGALENLQRLAVAPQGSGTRFLAMKLLKANGIDTAPAVQLDAPAPASAQVIRV